MHDLLRRAVQREFSVARIEEQRLVTEQIIDDLLGATGGGQPPPVDLVSAFAAAVPARFTCGFLGVPLEHADFFTACLNERFNPAGDHDSVRRAEDALADGRSAYRAAVTAPSTGMHTPVTNRESSDAKNSAAYATSHADPL